MTKMISFAQLKPYPLTHTHTHAHTHTHTSHIFHHTLHTHTVTCYTHVVRYHCKGCVWICLIDRTDPSESGLIFAVFNYHNCCMIIEAVVTTLHKAASYEPRISIFMNLGRYLRLKLRGKYGIYENNKKIVSRGFSS